MKAITLNCQSGPARRHVWPALIVCLGACLAQAQTTPVGGVARDFTIVNHASGQPLRLSDYAGNIILLDFFAWWCGPCNASSPDVETNIMQFYRRRGGNHCQVPVQVISINIESEDPARTDLFISQYGLELVGDDFSGVAYNQFDLGGIPLFVVINGMTNCPDYRPWEVLYRYAGYNRSAITNAIEKVCTVEGPVAPAFAHHPTSRVIVAGGKVTFDTKATGLPYPSYQWLSNDVVMARQTNATLTLSNVTPSHAGPYRVRATNILGCVTSLVAQLTVLVNPTNAGMVDTGFHLSSGTADWTRDDTIYSLLLQADGKVVFGGYFYSTLDGSARNHIARLNPNGALDTTFNAGSGPDGSVFAMALQSDGKIMIGGSFSTVNGTSRARLARLNTSGSLDTGLANPNLAGGSVYAVAVQPDGKMLIGGGFTTVNSTARNRIARLNTNGSLDTSFDPGSGANSYVYSLALQPDGKLLVGGSFSSFNGVTCNSRIVRLTSNGLVDATFNGVLQSASLVAALAVQPDGKILAGGQLSFRPTSGTTANIARLNTNGTSDATFTPGAGADDYVWVIALQPDGKMVLGGTFTTFSGRPCERLVRLHPNGTPDTNFGAHLEIRLTELGYDAWVYGLALQSNGEVVAGGYFDEINGLSRFGTARLHGDYGGHALLLAPCRLGGGQFQFTLAGQPGKTYSLQTSTNLRTWALWKPQACTSQWIQCQDTQTPGSPAKFYRASTPD